MEKKTIVVYVRKSLSDLMDKEIEFLCTNKNRFMIYSIIEKLMFSEYFQKELINACEKRARDFRYYELLKEIEKINSIKTVYQESAQKIIKQTYELFK